MTKPNREKLLVLQKTRAFAGVKIKPTPAGILQAQLYVRDDVKDLDRVEDDDYLEKMLVDLLETGLWAVDRSPEHPVLTKAISSQRGRRYVAAARDPVAVWALGHPVYWRSEADHKHRESASAVFERVRLFLRGVVLAQGGNDGDADALATTLLGSTTSSYARWDDFPAEVLRRVKVASDTASACEAHAEDGDVHCPRSEYDALTELGKYLDTLPRGADKNEPNATTALRLLQEHDERVEQAAWVVVMKRVHGDTPKIEKVNDERFHVSLEDAEAALATIPNDVTMSGLPRAAYEVREVAVTVFFLAEGEVTMKKRSAHPGFKHFSQKKADAAGRELHRLVEDFVLSHGGKKNDGYVSGTPSSSYVWTLPTKFGPYGVSDHFREGETGLLAFSGYLTVFGSFDDILKQQQEDFHKPVGTPVRPFPAGFPANHHKYNFHFGTYQSITPEDAFEQWEYSMLRLLPERP